MIADAVTGQQQFGQAAVGSIVGKEAVYVDALGNQMTGMISQRKSPKGERSSSTALKCRSTEWSHTPAGSNQQIPDIPADVASMSRSEMLTGTDPVYVPYDGPVTTVRTVVSKTVNLSATSHSAICSSQQETGGEFPRRFWPAWPKQNQGSPLMQSHQTTPKASCSSSQQQRTGWAWTHQTQHQRAMVPLATSEPNLRSSTTWRWQSPQTTQARGGLQIWGPPYAETEAYVEKVLRCRLGRSGANPRCLTPVTVTYQLSPSVLMHEPLQQSRARIAQHNIRLEGTPIEREKFQSAQCSLQSPDCGLCDA